MDHDLAIRVGDFGLTRDIYTANYYRANRNAKLPVKWMPPETLHDGISNELTDMVQIFMTEAMLTFLFVAVVVWCDMLGSVFTGTLSLSWH